MVSAGDVTLNPSSRLATRHGKDIPLTRKQFELLNRLMESRRHIHGLRAKLESPLDHGEPLIRTVHGTGYMFEAT